MNFLHLIFIFLFAGSMLECNNIGASKSADRRSEKNAGSFEGYLTFSHKVMSVDNKEAFDAKSKILLNGIRTCFMYNNNLIDVAIQSNFVDSTYNGTDTTGFIFQDFTLLKFIKFDKFSVDAKILDSGALSKGGTFSVSDNDDPLKEYELSMFIIRDTILHSKKCKVVSLNIDAAEEPDMKRILSMIKFYIDPEIKGFPIQLSRKLSKLINNEFVFRREMPMPTGDAVLKEEFRFQDKKLPDSMVAIFNTWSKMLNGK